jgi:hypothetical protein
VFFVGVLFDRPFAWVMKHGWEKGEMERKLEPEDLKVIFYLRDLILIWGNNKIVYGNIDLTKLNQ